MINVESIRIPRDFSSELRLRVSRTCLGKEAYGKDLLFVQR